MEISLSYWMQYSIAVGAFILLQCLDSWVYYSYLIGLRMIKGLSPKAAKKEAMDFQKKWIDRHLKILLMALVEFQKAQCFFILPVQAAALAALSGHTNILTPVNIKKVTEPVLLLRLVGINGILPVILILFTLHGAGQKSWYVFGLSTIALALSAATLFTASEPHLFDGYGIDSRYSACAYQDPSALCVNPDPVTYFPSLSFGLSGVLSITTLSLVVLAILTLDFLWNPEKPTMVPIRDWLIRCIDQRRHKHAIQPEQYKGKPIGSTRPKRFQLQLKRECVHNLVRVIYSLTYLVVWAFLLFYLAIGFLDWIFLDPVDGMLDTDLWSLGQIVAVTIWAAPLCEWVYLEFRRYSHHAYKQTFYLLITGGLEEGSKYRIPKPFKVVEEIDDEVTTQRPERVGSLPQSVARNLLSRLGCFRGSASANIAYDQTLNSTADDALRSMGTPASSNTVPNSHSRHSGSRKQPYGSQTQSSGHKRLRADPFEETVERKIARAVLKGHSEEGSFF